MTQLSVFVVSITTTHANAHTDVDNQRRKESRCSLSKDVNTLSPSLLHQTKVSIKLRRHSSIIHTCLRELCVQLWQRQFIDGVANCIDHGQIGRIFNMQQSDPPIIEFWRKRTVGARGTRRKACALSLVSTHCFSVFRKFSCVCVSFMCGWTIHMHPSAQMLFAVVLTGWLNVSLCLCVPVCACVCVCTCVCVCVCMCVCAHVQVCV